LNQKRKTLNPKGQKKAKKRKPFNCQSKQSEIWEHTHTGYENAHIQKGDETT
jgi:hypothetical protein